MLQAQKPLPQFKTQASVRKLMTIKKFTSPNSLTPKNYSSSSTGVPSISIPIPESRNRQWSPSKKREVARSRDTLNPEHELQKDRIVIAKLNKDSKIEFGLKSQNTQTLKPLEPFVQAIRKDQNRSNFRISPKHALLYKDGIDFLPSKFQKPSRDQNNRSLEVVRNHIDDFCQGQANALRIPKPKATGPAHRRRSCVCTWCGGASALEKAIQNQPGIPATICQKHHVEDIKPLPLTPSSNNSSRQSSKGRLKANTPMRTPKKSTFGTFFQACMAMDGGTPRSSVRSLQAIKVPSLHAQKDFMSPPETQVALDSQNIIQSITLEEDSATSISPKDTLTVLNKKKPAISLTWRDVAPPSSSIENKRLLINNNNNNIKELQEFQEKMEENIFKFKRAKTRRTKTQLHLASTVQTIKELYANPCTTTPKVERCSPQPQSYRENLNGLSVRKKVGSSISWGLELPKVHLPMSEKVSPRNLLLKTETSPREELRRVMGKPKTDPQRKISLNNIRTLKTLYQSQTGKSISSPKLKTVVKKECTPVNNQVDEYMITV